MISNPAGRLAGLRSCFTSGGTPIEPICFLWCCHLHLHTSINVSILRTIHTEQLFSGLQTRDLPSAAGWLVDE